MPKPWKDSPLPQEQFLLQEHKMAITTSNTFHTAAISDTISSARGYWNSSFQALLRNFNSANATPNANNCPKTV